MLRKAPRFLAATRWRACKMKNEGDKISTTDLEISWTEILSTFDKFIENGHKLRPIRFLIRHIIENGYSRRLFAGSSLWSLLISLPSNLTVDFARTLRVDIDQLTSTVKFTYKNKLARPDEPIWTETCQLTEIIDIFEYFIEINKDWKEIKNTTRQHRL